VAAAAAAVVVVVVVVVVRRRPFFCGNFKKADDLGRQRPWAIGNDPSVRA